MDASKVFAHSRDIGMVVDAAGMILAGTQGGEDALAYGSLGLVGVGLNSILDETPPVPLFGAEEVKVARLYRDIHIKTGPGRILTIHAITFPLGDSIAPHGARLLVEQEMHRAVPEARGIGKPLGLLFDSVGAAVWSFDADGTVLTWNRTSEAYFGHSRAGQFSPASVFVSVEDLNRVRQAVDGGGSYHGTVALASRDGKARVNKVWVTRMISEQGDPVGYACVSLDPEENTRAEDLQKAIAQQPGDAIFLIDRETTQILDVNLKACELLCSSREDLLRKRVVDFMSEGRPSLGAEIQSALTAEGVMQLGRQLFRRKDGFLMPAIMTIMPATLGPDRCGLAFLLDLSSRVRIEDTVRKERESLDRQLTEEREVLKKSIQAQQAELADLRRQAAESRKREEGLTRMVTETRKREEGLGPELEAAREREEKLAKDLEAARALEADLRRQIEELQARPAPPPPEPPKPTVDVNRVLEEALGVFEEKAGRKVKVTRSLKHVPPVDCLPDLLKEVVLSALDGIAEGAGKKGRINIRTRQNRRGAVIEIVDKGGGIGPTVLARLFDPAMAESKSRVTAALVPGGGGKISFRVSPGKSALCRIELPAPR